MPDVDRATKVISSPSGMLLQSRTWRSAGLSIALVPTMGALHDGHLSLVRRARADNDRVVVSVFVNPLQFDVSSDLARYPRDPKGDVAVLRDEGVDVVYMPSVDDMYPQGACTRVHVGHLSDVLEGAHRLGHYDGVATVVTKLFNSVLPERAYFGQKDAQQVAIIKRMARDLDTGIEVVVMPTVREADGLALSSRNARLSASERGVALVLSQALRATNELWLGGETDSSRLRAAMVAVLDSQPLAKADYAEVVDPEDFVSPGNLAVLAVWVGEVRLIDNHRLGQPMPSPAIS